MPPDALRKGRENQLIEDGTYPGLEEALDEAEQMMSEGLDQEMQQNPQGAPQPGQFPMIACRT
jgi:hypothetical protein